MKFASLADSRIAARLGALAVAGAVALAAGCDGRRESREVLNMPDMHFSTTYKAQEPNPMSPTGSTLLPVEGTVPTHWQPYTIADADADRLANALENPLPRTEEVLRTGEKYYNIFCVMCHGPAGDGMGTVIKANAGMPMPPTFHSDKMTKEWKDGRIFHVITRGQGNMPSYAARIEPQDRWAVVHYVRTIQQAGLKAQAAEPAAKPAGN